MTTSRESEAGISHSSEVQGVERISYTPPRLVILCGAPCGGKTTTALEIAKRIHVVYIDKDSLQDPFTEEREGVVYQSVREQTFQGMYNIAGQNILAGNSVIIDAPFDNIDRWTSLQRWLPSLSQNSVKLKVIRCHASDTEIRRRMSERNSPRDKSKLDDWEEYRKKYPIMFNIPLPHIDLDTQKSLELVIQAALEYLAK